MFIPLSIFAQGNKYIVVLKDHENVEQVASSHKVKVKYSYEVINGYSATLSPEQFSNLRQDPRVKYIEPDGFMYPQTIEPNVYWTLSMVNNRTLLFGDTFSYEYFNTGKGVNVYILDSGILTYHPDFGGRAKEVWTIRKGRKVDQINCGGHGTAVAGVAGGTLTGVAKEVNLLSVTMTECNVGAALVSDMVSAIDFVSRQKGTKLANISYSGGRYQTILDALAGAYRKNTLFFLAAGNDGIDACNTAPASFPDAITVGGVRNDGYDDGYTGGASWSGFNYGTCLDVMAPILGWTDWYQNDGTTFTGGAFGGTSFSTPHGLGIAALYLELHPNASAQEVMNAVLSNSTPGILHIDGTGSPNLLLYSKF